MKVGRRKFSLLSRGTTIARKLARKWGCIHTATRVIKFGRPEFTRKFASQLPLHAWSKVSSTLIGWSNENKRCMRSWQTRFYMRDSSTLFAWSHQNKSCMRVDKREFTWEIPQFSLLIITPEEELHESWHESFLNSHWHCLIKREQAFHESWQTRFYMRDSSTLIAWFQKFLYVDSLNLL